MALPLGCWPTMTIVSIASPRQTTKSTKRLSIMAGTAARPIAPGSNYTMRAKIAGIESINGGTKMATAGTQNATGTTMITTMIEITITKK